MKSEATRHDGSKQEVIAEFHLSSPGMSYQLECTETLTEGLQRIAGELLDEMIAGLRDEANRDEGIHNARTGCKKLRALLRLGRSGLPETLVMNENMRFRDASRLLSALREAYIYIASVDLLLQHLGTEGAALVTLRTALVQRFEHLVAANHQAERTTRAIQLFQTARDHLNAWVLDHKDAAVLREGLGRSFRQGKQRMRRALHDPSAENLHEWRKAVKYLMYQTRLLHPAQPDALLPFDQMLQTLSDYLGDDHDLAVLHRLLEDEPALLLDADASDEVRALIDRRRSQLQEAIWPLGAAVYHEKPTDFAARLTGYWNRWQQHEPA